jgi:hypothetical protein
VSRVLTRARVAGRFSETFAEGTKWTYLIYKQNQSNYLCELSPGFGVLPGFSLYG